MSEVVITKSQEEYEDDFEKDLDWLISEESRSEDQVSNLSEIYWTGRLCFSFLLSVIFFFITLLLSFLSVECCSTYCRLGAA